MSPTLNPRASVAQSAYPPFALMRHVRSEHHNVLSAVDALEEGCVGLLIKLRRVTAWLVKDRPDLAVAPEAPTSEHLGVLSPPDGDVRFYRIRLSD
jgi:hypothetical protein